MPNARPHHRRYPSRIEPDVDGALDTMSAQELRSFVQEVLERLDDKQAFLGGDYATARAIYQALLLPIAEAEIELGQDELVDEVLTINVHACAAQYLVTVYATTPLEARPEALCQAIGAVDGITTFWEPLGDMERVAAAPLPELDAFLPLWLARVEREPTSVSDWESDRDRWLREAAERLEGVAVSNGSLARQRGPRHFVLGAQRSRTVESGPTRSVPTKKP